MIRFYIFGLVYVKIHIIFVLSSRFCTFYFTNTKIAMRKCKVYYEQENKF
jgi:hypothetical protein